MATITEDYVSFETAKLLKEKGFDAECRAAYTNYGKLFTTQIQQYITNALCSKGILWDCIAPTLQMAMKWLREVHNLCIEPYRTASGYLYTISKIWTGSEIYSDEFNGDDEDSGQWTTYEKACEAAIKYCLENLI